ncbi:MAG: OmpA family protein [Saprospiraceae bacterium]
MSRKTLLTTGIVVFLAISLFELMIPVSLFGQKDTLYFFDFENVRTDAKPNTKLESIENNSGIFQDMLPCTTGIVTYGRPWSDKTLGSGEFNVGKQFLYHMPSWYKKKPEGVSFNHIELKLIEPLLPNQLYKLSFLIGNMKSHKYKPAHYGVKYSTERVTKSKTGSLLSKPDLFFDFTNDTALVKIQTIIYPDGPIKYFYFGMFEEDTLRIQKPFVPFIPKISNTATLQYYRTLDIVKPTRVVLDNILIEKIEKVESKFRDVYFEVDDDQLHSSSDLKVIGDIANLLSKKPELSLLIQGYTDETGTVVHNMELSKRRAESIRKILLDSGISEDRIMTYGKGIFNEKSIEDRKIARKVSFMLFR